jgi:hypothetical protein
MQSARLSTRLSADKWVRSWSPGRFRKRGGALLDVDFEKVRRAAEASLSFIFEAGGYHPDYLGKRFPHGNPAVSRAQLRL